MIELGPKGHEQDRFGVSLTRVGLRLRKARSGEPVSACLGKAKSTEGGSKLGST